MMTMSSELEGGAISSISHQSPKLIFPMSHPSIPSHTQFLHSRNDDNVLCNRGGGTNPDFPIPRTISRTQCPHFTTNVSISRTTSPFHTICPHFTHNVPILHTQYPHFTPNVPISHTMSPSHTIFPRHAPFSLRTHTPDPESWTLSRFHPDPQTLTLRGYHGLQNRRGGTCQTFTPRP